MSKYRHIIWDWNGTLLDDAWLSVEITNQLMERRGMPAITHRRYQEVFGFPLEEYCIQLGFDFATESFEQLSDEFIRVYEQRRLECQLQPNAVEVLQAVQRAGVEQSILSAYRQQTLEELISHFQLEGFFVRLTGVDNDRGEGKIHNGKCWIEELSYPGAQVGLIGDTLHDWEVAQAMGVDCALVLGGHQSRERLEACGARVAEKLKDILDLMEIAA